jgi:hypothetical protein
MSSHRFFSVIGDSKECVRIKSKMNKMIAYYALIFQFESKNFNVDLVIILQDKMWIPYLRLVQVYLQVSSKMPKCDRTDVAKKGPVIA